MRKNDIVKLVCQRPKRASSISTYPKGEAELIRGLLGVNALNGLLPFLQRLFLTKRRHKKCVNALNGLLPFLRRSTIGREANVLKGVNALNGLLPFLR